MNNVARPPIPISRRDFRLHCCRSRTRLTSRKPSAGFATLRFKDLGSYLLTAETAVAWQEHFTTHAPRLTNGTSRERIRGEWSAARLSRRAASWISLQCATVRRCSQQVGIVRTADPAQDRSIRRLRSTKYWNLNTYRSQRSWLLFVATRGIFILTW